MSTEAEAAQFLVNQLADYYPISIKGSGWDFYQLWLQGEFDLKDRESQVAIEALRGFEHREIATRLNISFETVNKHLDNVYKKAGVHSKMGLAAKILEGTGIT